MVLVANPFPCACCPCQLKHPLAIPAEHSLVEVEHDPGFFVLERVIDQRRQAACPSIAFGAASPSVVDEDPHPEASHSDDHVRDLALPRITLILHVKAALTGKDEVAQLLPGNPQVIAVHACSDDEIPPRLALVDVHIHSLRP